jgi:hypothetical protein
MCFLAPHGLIDGHYVGAWSLVAIQGVFKAQQRPCLCYLVCCALRKRTWRNAAGSESNQQPRGYAAHANANVSCKVVFIHNHQR